MKEKLSSLQKKEKIKFLLSEHRELKLIKKLDELTDKYRALDKLISSSLKILLRYFNCETAAFLQLEGNDGSHSLPDQGFLFSSMHPEPPENMKEMVKQILIAFLTEPRDLVSVNSPTKEQQKAGIKNYIMVPMILRSQIEGAFLISNRARDFDLSDGAALKQACSQLDNAVEFCRYVKEHKKVTQNLKKQTRELQILYEMSLSLSYGYDFETLSRRILENVLELLKLDRASIMKFDSKLDELHTIVVVGEKQKVRLVKLGMGKGIAGLVLTNGKPILAPLGSEDNRFIPYDFAGIKPKKIFSLACIPLMADETPIGIINFSTLSSKKSIKQKHMETLTVASHMISLALQRQQFYQLSIKDELTGLFCFRYFKERLEEEVTRCRRYKIPFSLLLFDLDHFKKINDTYGHPFGNVVLKKVSEILLKNIRIGVDMPARFGGEELSIILPHTESEGAEIVAQRIRNQIETLDLEFENKPVPITISGGISTFPHHSDTPDGVLKAADQALYKAKEEGRNRIIVAEKKK
ncbi:MAG: sensor domain-containing diguanylate cyclase [Candidatus Riflebacteria bacterium]|nr:sensor domain-containing diguanylate cyclase [Candidatus Riflebacteria bacterium]